MNYILLTKSNTFLIGWVAKLLGYIMNGIFFVIDKIGIPNIGLAIILFTIVIYLLMMPLTVKQQKFSKLSAKINPELEAIKKKYKGKNGDQNAMMAQNQEIQAVYAKYGVSPTGSCVQLLIQMPILFALYSVIRSMPAYVTRIGDTFRILADKIISVDNGNFLANSGVDSIASTVKMYGSSMNNGNLENGIVDVLNKLSSADMATISEHYGLGGLLDPVTGRTILGDDGLLHTFNNFLGLNMGDSPMQIIKSAWEIGAIAVVIGAVLIPVLAAVTQWINVKLMPQQATNSASDEQNTMAQSMKTMNTVMPLMSAWLCTTLPAGMGLYWIAGSVVRSIQQVIVNKQMDKMDFEEIIKKNSEKSAKKIERMKQNQEKMSAYASMKTKAINSSAKVNTNSNNSESDYSSSVPSTPAKAGSMREKANMVRRMNENNNKND